MATVRVTDATRLWLLDEPFSAQDIAWQRRLLQYLRELNRALVATVHDLNQVRVFATHVLLLSDGAVLAQGAARDVMRSELLSRAFGVDLQVDDTGWVSV
jgi:iron complex transport system ATP-binding protein